ncbi:hypothetical protein Q7P37_008765 [Cladosporium fusiforme]
MKLAMLAEASQHWKQLQERGFEETAAAAATTVAHHVTRTLVARQDTTCLPDDDSAKCQKPVAGTDTQTLAIALGAGIPLAAAAIVLIFLHQRHVRKQRLEDKNDPHKSLDFGMSGVEPHESKWAKQRKGKNAPEMSVTEVDGKSGRKDRGLSMDELSGLGNPYLLPGEVVGSGASIHSMSRSFQDDHDPYRPVTFVKGDGESTRSRPFNEKGSVYSAATSMHSTERSGLVVNASRMSQSFPKRGDSKEPLSPLSPQSTLSADDSLNKQLENMPGMKPSQASEPSLSNIAETGPRIDVQSPPPPPEKEEQALPTRTTSAAASSGPAARKGSLPHIVVPPPPRQSTQSSIYDDYDATAASPPANANEPPRQPRGAIPSLMVEEPHAQNQRLSVMGLNLAETSAPNNRLSVMGLRPLPPANVVDDNPESRANRIRSFYKEYFDDSKPEPAGAQYQETYDLDYLTDAPIYDPETGGFVTAGAPPGARRPFAEPLGRRAMTPPPRGAATPVGGPHQRQFSTQTVGRFGPRPPGGAMMPKKPLPPPMPLKSLPTPHLLKDDTAIFNADDFAPPTSYRDRQAGRSDSPTGSLRPYSPSVAAHNPLVKTYDELAPMPSPFALRKSGTFTALDFAPPGRIRSPGEGGMSETGSIRSNRSGISNMHSDALRAGAYRVSRLPPEMVGTRDDLAAQLKPSWDMRRDNALG